MRGRNELVLQYDNSMVGEGALHPPFAGIDKDGENSLIVGFYGRGGTTAVVKSIDPDEIVEWVQANSS
jgi:hypothetical protein